MRTGNFMRCFFACSVIVPFFWASAAGAGSPKDIQEKRTLTMKTINKLMRRIRVYAGKGDIENAAQSAMEVSSLIARIPELSPPNSAFGEKSRIKPVVWKEFDRYKELTGKSVSAARALAKTARGGDRSTLMPAFAALAKSCGACHKPYRKKKKRK